MIQKMDKKLMVSFLLAVSVLFLLASVSATSSIANITNVEVNGVSASSNPAVNVGDTVTVRVDFTGLANVQGITVQATLEGNSQNTQASTDVFDVESGSLYTKSLNINVPFDLKNSLSDSVNLHIRISGNGFSTEADYTLKVQRSSYVADIQSVITPQQIKAGQLFPVDFVIQNDGYNDLTSLYVTASIPALGVTQTVFVGDLVALTCNTHDTTTQDYGVNITRKCNENGQETVSGRVFLQLPYSVQTGTYAIQLNAFNGDTSSSQTAQVSISNDFSSGNFIVSGNQMLIVNPTNNVVVYRLVPESTGSASISVSDTAIAVPAGASKTVTTQVSGVAAGQTYTVDVFDSSGNLVQRVNFTAPQVGASSPVIVLTIILAIIFIVLLVVLIVLIGKKPEKSEEFGESYY